MYCNYFKNNDGREWYSVSIDNDEVGQSIVRLIVDFSTSKAIDALNENDIDEARRNIEVAKEFKEALEKGERHEEN